MLDSAFERRTLTALNQDLRLAVIGFAGAVVQLAGTWVATLTFEVTADGVTWVAVNAVQSNGSSVVTTATTPGAYVIAIAGFRLVRVRVSAFTSGAIDATVSADPGGPGGGSSGGGGGGGAVTIADGADVTEGAIADAAVTGDNVGTVNGHLRGVDKILGDVWNSVAHYLKVSIQNTSILVTQGALPFGADYVGYTATSGTVDTFVYKTGGSGGTTVATVTVTYVDSTHAVLVSVAVT